MEDKHLVMCTNNLRKCLEHFLLDGNIKDKRKDRGEDTGSTAIPNCKFPVLLLAIGSSKNYFALKGEDIFGGHWWYLSYHNSTELVVLNSLKE